VIVRRRHSQAAKIYRGIIKTNSERMPWLVTILASYSASALSLEKEQ
jgi:hypothetical protein